MKLQFDFIDFLDSSQVYLDIISSCSGAINHYANLADDEDLKSILASLGYSIAQLKKIFANYSDLYITSKSIEGGNENG